MNILLFSRICAKTGVGGHMRQLADELVEQGHSVWILSSSNEQGIAESNQLKVVLAPFDTKNPLVMWKNIITIRHIINDNQIEIVHCHHRVAALYMRVYRLLWDIPMVYTLHLAPVPCDIFHRTLTFVGDMGIGVSTEVVNFMREKLRIPKEKTTTILNGVTPPNIGGGYSKDELLCRFSIPEDKYVLLLNSRIATVKNHMLMVEAVHELPDEIKSKIVVVCTGEKSGSYYESLLQKIDEYKLKDSFIFVGWVNPYEILAVSDFLFLPSFSEGFPLNVVEAFLSRVPVARTATAGWEDTKFGCAQIYSDRTTEIKEIITTLVKTSAEAFSEQVNRAYEFAVENLTVKKMTQNTLLIYSKVIEEHHGESRH